MLRDPGYAESWQWKQAWYERNGFVVGKDVIAQTWVCPGVGAVKMIEYPRSDNPKAARVFELRSYKKP